MDYSKPLAGSLLKGGEEEGPGGVTEVSPAAAGPGAELEHADGDGMRPLHHACHLDDGAAGSGALRYCNSYSNSYSPHAFVFSVENAVCKDSYRQRSKEKINLRGHCATATCLTSWTACGVVAN